jgi:hypothetical protein
MKIDSSDSLLWQNTWLNNLRWEEMYFSLQPQRLQCIALGFVDSEPRVRQIIMTVEGYSCQGRQEAEKRERTRWNLQRHIPQWSTSSSLLHHLPKQSHQPETKSLTHKAVGDISLSNHDTGSLFRIGIFSKCSLFT